MITNNGKTHIARYLIGWEPSLALGIGYGIGDSSPDASDTNLEFPVGITPIKSRYIDYENNIVIFKAGLPSDMTINIREICLYNYIEPPLSNDTRTRVLSDFTNDDVVWSDIPEIGGSLGGNGIRHNSTTSSTAEVTYDFSWHSPADEFRLAVEVAATTNKSELILYTSDNDYFTIEMGTSIATGNTVLKATKGSAVETGTPDWSNITKIEIKTTGSADILYDALLVYDTDSLPIAYVTVARDLPATAVSKTDGDILDIEYKLEYIL